MSFTYAGESMDNYEGVEVTPLSYPNAGGLTLDTLEIPGRDGRFYGGSHRVVTQFQYRVTITGATPQEAEDRRDKLMRLLDPAKGPRPFVMDTDTEWVYLRVTLASEIDWEKHAFGEGKKVIYDGDVTFETQGDSSARMIDPPSVLVPSGGSVDYTHDYGTTASYPMVIYRVDTGSSASDIHVGIGDFELLVSGTYSSGTEILLDWYMMRFYELDSSGQRVRSLVNRLSTYERPTLMTGETYALSCSCTGDGQSTFYPEPRRA